MLRYCSHCKEHGRRHTKPHRAATQHTKPNQTKPNQTTPRRHTAQHSTPHQTTPHQTTPRRHTAHHTTPNQTKPNQTKPNLTAPPHSTPHHAVPPVRTQTKYHGADVEACFHLIDRPNDGAAGGAAPPPQARPAPAPRQDMCFHHVWLHPEDKNAFFRSVQVRRSWGMVAAAAAGVPHCMGASRCPFCGCRRPVRWEASSPPPAFFAMHPRTCCGCHAFSLMLWLPCIPIHAVVATRAAGHLRARLRPARQPRQLPQRGARATAERYVCTAACRQGPLAAQHVTHRVRADAAEPDGAGEERVSVKACVAGINAVAGELRVLGKGFVAGVVAVADVDAVAGVDAVAVVDA
eukprot:238186-Chlamydomonas_euryale.AAC.1